MLELRQQCWHETLVCYHLATTSHSQEKASPIFISLLFQAQSRACSSHVHEKTTFRRCRKPPHKIQPCGEYIWADMMDPTAKNRTGPEKINYISEPNLHRPAQRLERAASPGNGSTLA